MTASAHKKIKNIVVYLVPAFFSNVLPLLTFPIMTRFLVPEDFGISALAMATVGIISSIVTCNMSSATQRYYFQYRKDINTLSQLINSSMAFLFVVFIVSSLLVFMGMNVISKLVMGSTAYAIPLLVAYAGNYLNIIVNLYLLLYRNMERAKEYSFFTIMQMVINIIITLLMACVFRMGYLSLIYPIFISSLIVTIILGYRFLKEYPFQFKTKMLIDNLIYGIPLLLNIFTSSISSFFDKYLLRSMVSLASTGLFSVAQNIGNKMFVFMTAVQSTFHPLIMKDMFDKGEDGASAVGRHFTIFTYICLSVVLPAILFGEEIIYILAPKSYSGVVSIFMIVLCGIATQTFGKVVGLPLEYAKKAYLSFPISIISVIANVGLNILLIPRYEAAGAAFAFAFTIILSNSIYIMISQRFYRIKYDWFVLFCLFANLFIAAVLLIYLRSIDASFIIKYFVKGFSVLAFLLIGKRTGIINKKNIKILIDIIMFKMVVENKTNNGITLEQ